MTNREAIAMDILDYISGVMNNVNEDDIQNLLEESDAQNTASTVSDGEEFMYCGIPFIRLGEEQGGILCITKQYVFLSRFNDMDNNDYGDSFVRSRLLNEFLPRVDCEELLPFEMDLTSTDGSRGYGVCSDYVGILTEKLYKKYRRYIDMCDSAMWLCTPYSPDRHFRYIICMVNSSGIVCYNTTNGTGMCRPACIFKKSS